MATIYGITATRHSAGWILAVPILRHTCLIVNQAEVESEARRLIAHLGEVSVEWIDDASQTA